MAEAYEHLLLPTTFVDESGNLKTEFKYTPLSADSEFSKKSFREGYDTHGRLEQASLSEYSQLMVGDNSLTRLPAALVEASKKGVTSVSLEGLVEFGRVHAKGIARLAEDAGPEGQTALANYALGVPYFRGEKGFDETLDEVEKSRKELESIRENPGKYVKEKLEGLNPLARAFYAPFGGENGGVIASDFESWAQNLSIIAIRKYGFPKFVATNIANAHTQGSKQKAEITQAEMAARKVLENLGDSPEEERVERIRKAAEGNAKRINEKYGNALQNERGLTAELMRLGRQYAEEPKKKEKDKK